MEKNNGGCFSSLSSNLPITCFIAFITIILFRVLYVIYRTGKPLSKRTLQQPLSTLIVLGSGALSNCVYPFSYLPLILRCLIMIVELWFLGIGGHTAEMINLLSVLQKERFTPRFYIAAATDNMSLQKTRVLENSLADSVNFATSIFHSVINSY